MALDIFADLFGAAKNLFTTTSELLSGEEDNGSGLLSRIGTAGLASLPTSSETFTKKTPVPDLSGARLSITAKQGEAIGPQPLQSVDMVAVQDKWIRLMKKHSETEKVISSTLVKAR